MLNRKVMIVVAALWASSAAAQTAISSGGAAAPGISASGPAARSGGSANSEGANSKTVTGKPLSATEERRTIQILADGTTIENTETDKFYRDGEGRTRIQRNDGSAVIHDPAQGVPNQVSPDGRVLHILPAVYDGRPPAESTERNGTATAESPVAVYEEEDLGSQSVNGVMARGSRTTTTIPVGQIGNDRPLRVVSERWYSTDLQIDVKTINSDPRYGETTYQLKDIRQGVQDGALFRHPTSAQPQK